MAGGAARLGPSNALAIAALTTALAALVSLVFAVPGGAVAIGLGIAGLVRSKSLPERRGGTMAKFGIGIGVLAILFVPLLIVGVGYLGEQATVREPAAADEPADNATQAASDSELPDADAPTSDAPDAEAGAYPPPGQGLNTDPKDGKCDRDRFLQDPDC